MKKLLLITSFLTFLLIFSTIAVEKTYAQGTCVCNDVGFGFCGLTNNSCAGGYSPTCTTVFSMCDGGASSCTCLIPGGPTPTIPPAADCGGSGEPCCMPGGVCSAGFNCQYGYCVPVGVTPPPGGGVYEVNYAIFCDSAGNPTKVNTTGQLYTAIGCIPISSSGGFLGFMLPWAIGIAGGIAFLLIIYASFMIITSGGNPQRLQAGKELLTAAVMGLLLLIFSVYILKVIGVDILKLKEVGL